MSKVGMARKSRSTWIQQAHPSTSEQNWSHARRHQVKISGPSSSRHKAPLQHPFAALRGDGGYRPSQERRRYRRWNVAWPSRTHLKATTHESHLKLLVGHRRDLLCGHRRSVLELVAVEPDSAKYDLSCPACCGPYRCPDLFLCLRDQPLPRPVAHWEVRIDRMTRMRECRALVSVFNTAVLSGYWCCSRTGRQRKRC
jgi:hypothetical protein